MLSFLVHANTVAALAAKKLPGVRFLQSIQTVQPKPRWHWWMQSLIHGKADRVVVPSQAVAEFAAAKCGIDPRKCEVIPNALDPADFPRVEVFQLPKTRVGYLGRLDPAKSPITLIDAIDALPDDVELHYFGDGPARFELNGAIVRKSLQNRATVHGPVQRPQLALSQMDILCLPSWVEGFGLVLIEAMASGVPVVACDAGGVRDVVVDGSNGLLIRDAQQPARAFALAIQRLRDDAATPRNPDRRRACDREQNVHLERREVQIREALPTVKINHKARAVRLSGGSSIDGGPTSTAPDLREQTLRWRPCSAA